MAHQSCNLCHLIFPHLDQLLHRIHLSTAAMGQVEIPIITSEVRDHLANERTFLSALKMSLSLALVAIVCYLDLRLNRTVVQDQPLDDRPVVHDKSRLTFALAYIFLSMSLLSIIAATIHYFRTQRRYIKRIGLVKEHWFISATLAAVGVAILLANGLLLLDERHANGRPAWLHWTPF